MPSGTEAMAKLSAQPRRRGQCPVAKPLALPGGTARRRLASFGPEFDRRGVLANFSRAIHAYRWRATEIARLLIRRARSTGRVKLQPDWLDDSVWRFAESSQLHVAKGR